MEKTGSGGNVSANCPPVSLYFRATLSFCIPFSAFARWLGRSIRRFEEFLEGRARRRQAVDLAGNDGLEQVD